MGILNEKYRYLRPSFDLLSDPVVLAQAWKKAETFIRRQNSYADVLELDVSVANAEALIDSWSSDVRSGTYSPAKLHLVEAPKGVLSMF